MTNLGSSVASGGILTGAEANMHSAEVSVDPETSTRLFENLIREIKELNERLDRIEARLNDDIDNPIKNIAKSGSDEARADGGKSKSKGGSSSVKGSGNSKNKNKVVIKLPKGFSGMPPQVTPNTPPVTPNTPPVTPNTPPVTPNTPPVTPNTPPVTPNTPPVTPNTPPVTPNTPPLSPAQQALEALKPIMDDARDRYALETAKDRNRFWGRFLESNNPIFSRFLKKIPGAEVVAGWINENLTKHDDMDSAREEYQKSLKQAQSLEATIILDKIDPNLPLAFRESIANSEYYKMIVREDVSLESMIVHHRGEQSARATRFSDWWARQEGFTGNIKKFASVVAAGAIAGATVAGAIALAPVAIPGAIFGVGLPTIAGGLTGAGMGLSLNKRLANSHTDKEKTKTVAQFESERDKSEKKSGLLQSIDNTLAHVRVAGTSETDAISGLSVEKIVKETEASTNERVKENRNRLKAIIGAAALAGGVSGAYVGGYLDNVLQGGSPDDANGAPAEKQPGTGVGKEGDGVPAEKQPGTDVGKEGDGIPHTEAPSGIENNFGSYDYPWTWAKEIFGEENAMNQLFDLAQKAQEAGYNIQWSNLGDGNTFNDWISINGNSETSYVISVLNQFR